MKRNHKLGKIFGPVAFIGIAIFLFLLYGVFYELLHNRRIIGLNTISFIIIFVFLLGAFVGFTTICTRIDYVNMRIKYTTKLFGIIPVGKWTYLVPEMKLGLKKTTERWGAYSMSNRSTSFEYNDLMIVLYDAEGTEIIPVQKIKKAEFAEAELEKLSKLLKLDIV